MVDESLIQSRRILGIDPGVNITGYGVLDQRANKLTIVEAGVIRGGKGELPDKVKRIFEGLRDLVESVNPDQLAIEKLYSHYAHPMTSIIMGHARGVICLAASQSEIPIYHYASTKIKKVLTGNGRASKEQIQASICREFNLPEPPEPNDVADALAIALCHAYLGKEY
ncbi:MAG: crossover junction endodeoxyribonuclease RuvC [Planctomycetaceae bacterium]|nr:crossover junction endodeoxyribonuclease RuvC [Planctomycetaceae bacterium]